MELESARCYEALRARDTRFDGVFFVGVSSTRIYCRPVCTVRLPLARNCSFYPHAAAAEQAGYRPCLRCRPELAPGHAPAVSPVDAIRTAAQWAGSRIEAGALNDEGDLEGLAQEYGVSSRQLRTAVQREFGVPPVQLAQTRRLLLAKQLLTETDLPMTQVASAAGFSSLRRFNHLFKTRYGLQPTALRRSPSSESTQDTLTLRLGYRPPLAWPALLKFLTGRGAAGVEAAEGPRYWRTVRWGTQRGWLCAEPVEGQSAIALTLSTSLMPVLTPLLARVRSLFDLDAHPQAIAQHLQTSVFLRPMIEQVPGLRVPGALDGFELALRVVLGQQITVKAATTVFGRFASRFGDPAVTPCAALKFYAPTAERVAEASLQQLIDLGLTTRRAETVQRLAVACASGTLRLEPGVNVQETMTRLQEIPGIGPWSAQYIAIRGLRWPDGFPYSDLVLMKLMGQNKPAAMLAASEPWRPWRAYACMHLWNSLNGGG